MPVFSDGTFVKEAEWNRLISSIPSSYTVYKDGSNYRAECNVAGGTDYVGADKDTVVQQAIDALGSGGTVFLKEIELGTATYGNNVLIVQYYQGKQTVYSNQGKHLHAPLLASNPATAGWGIPEEAFSWYNTTEHKFKYWNGSAIGTLPSIEGTRTYKLAPSYTLYKSDATYYLMDEDGNIDFSGSTLHTVMNDGIDAMGDGEKMFVKHGVYTLTGSVEVDKPFTLEGEHGFGDLFFTSDAFYTGYTDKTGVLFVDGDVTGIDMFKLGFKQVEATNRISFGIHFKNFSISGYETPPVGGGTDGTQKANSGILIQNVNSCTFENLGIYRKANGVQMQTANGASPANRNDIIHFRNIQLAYNEYGIISVAYGSEELRFENIYGYINEKNLLGIKSYYDVIMTNIFSNADDWSGAGDVDSPIRVDVSGGNAFLRNLHVYNTFGVVSGDGGIYINLAGGASAKVYIDTALIQGVDSDAIIIGGEDDASVFIRDLYVGSPTAGGVMGGSGDITGSVIKNNNANIYVYVDGGYVKCDQAIRNFFYNIKKGSIKNLQNFNPYGVLADPFNTAATTVGVYDPGGCAAAPTASTDYEVVTTDICLTSSGGTGVDITIKDNAGNTVASGLATLSAQWLPLGYKINFGAFAAAPTVIVSGN